MTAKEDKETPPGTGAAGNKGNRVNTQNQFSVAMIQKIWKCMSSEKINPG